jgi:hypothetical protein
MRILRIALASIAAAAAILGALEWLGVRDAGSGSTGMSDSRARPSPVAKDKKPSDTSPSTTPFERPGPGTTSIGLSMQFETTPDLYAFALRASRPTATANEKAYASQALRACIEVSNSSVDAVIRAFGDSLPRADPNNGMRLRLFAQSTERCRGFEGRPVSRDEITRLASEAAAQGSPLALSAKLLDIERAKGRDAATAVVEGIWSSGDPNAILQTLSYVQRPGVLAIGGPGDSRTSPLIGGAVVLALCDLGLDCRPTGQYLTATCTSLNRCNVASVDELIEGSVSANDRETLTSYRAVIREAIRARNWAALFNRAR